MIRSGKEAPSWLGLAVGFSLLALWCVVACFLSAVYLAFNLPVKFARWCRS